MNAYIRSRFGPEYQKKAHHLCGRIHVLHLRELAEGARTLLHVPTARLLMEKAFPFVYAASGTRRLAGCHRRSADASYRPVCPRVAPDCRRYYGRTRSDEIGPTRRYLILEQAGRKNRDWKR